MGKEKENAGDPVSPQGTPKKPIPAGLGLMAVEILKGMTSLEPGGDFMRARGHLLEMKAHGATGASLLPYQFHEHLIEKAAGIAWEIHKALENAQP